MVKGRARGMVTNISTRQLGVSGTIKNYQRPPLEEQIHALRTEFYAFKAEFLISQELRFRELRLLREELLSQASNDNGYSSSEISSRLQSSPGEQRCHLLHAGRRFVGTGRVVTGGDGPPPPDGFLWIILDEANDPVATLLTPEPSDLVLADMVGACICWPTCFLHIHR